MGYYVYILQNKKTKITYTGCASNLRKRLQEHINGFSPYTKHRGPFTLVWFAYFTEKNKAFQFEKYLKTGSGRAFVKKHLL